jgi:hypothetical protein
VRPSAREGNLSCVIFWDFTLEAACLGQLRLRRRNRLDRLISFLSWSILQGEAEKERPLEHSLPFIFRSPTYSPAIFWQIGTDEAAQSKFAVHMVIIFLFRKFELAPDRHFQFISSKRLLDELNEGFIMKSNRWAVQQVHILSGSRCFFLISRVAGQLTRCAEIPSQAYLGIMRLLHPNLKPGIVLITCWTMALFVLSCVRSWWRPQPCTTVESISGFYGRGTYWAWILTTFCWYSYYMYFPLWTVLIRPTVGGKCSLLACTATCPHWAPVQASDSSPFPL